MRVLALVLLTSLVSLGNVSEPPKDPGAETESVKALMGEINAAWENEDIEVFSRIVDHDAAMVNFGTDVSDRWVGWEALKAGLLQQFEMFSNTKVVPHHMDVRLSGGNTVAWLTQDMTMTTQFMGSPVPLALEARITAVFEKRDETWKMVHFHYSVPISEAGRIGL